MECRYCRSQIDSEAVICPICHRSQNTFRNELLFAGSIVGVLALLVSAITYVGKEVNALLQKKLKGDAILIDAFLERDNAVIRNVGYRGLNVLRLEISIPDFSRRILYDVYSSIPKNEMIQFNVGEKRTAYLVPTGSEPFNMYLAKLERWARDKTVPYVYPIAAKINDPDYNFRKDDYTSLKIPWPKEYGCEGTVYFVPFGENVEKKITFECIGMIYSEMNLIDLLHRIQTGKSGSINSAKTMEEF